jgi:hypothetical protein
MNNNEDLTVLSGIANSVWVVVGIVGAVLVKQLCREAAVPGSSCAGKQQQKLDKQQEHQQ